MVGLKTRSDCDADGYPMEGLWDRRIGADGLVREPSVYLRPLPAVTVLRFKATAIAQRRADWGLAIAPVARMYGLGFLPVAPEHYDFLVAERRRGHAAVEAFLAALRDEPTRARIRALGMEPA